MSVLQYNSVVVRMKKVCLFWDDILISKFDYEDKKELFDVGKKLLEQGLRSNHSLTYQRYVYRTHLSSVSSRKKDKKPIWNSDHQLALGAMTALVIMRDIEELDDPSCGLFFPPLYKKSFNTKKKIKKI